MSYTVNAQGINVDHWSKCLEVALDCNIDELLESVDSDELKDYVLSNHPDWFEQDE